MATKIIPDSVKEVLNYDKDTGILTWKVDRSNYVKAGDVAGTPSSKGYLVVRCHGEMWYAHRLAWFLVHGEQPDQIDHINRDKTDNRLKNLRNVDQFANALNRKRKGIGFYYTYNKARGRGRWTWQSFYGNKTVYSGKNIVMAYFRLTMAHRARLPIGIPHL